MVRVRHGLASEPGSELCQVGWRVSQIVYVPGVRFENVALPEPLVVWAPVVSAPASSVALLLRSMKKVQPDSAVSVPTSKLPLAALSSYLKAVIEAFR